MTKRYISALAACFFISLSAFALTERYSSEMIRSHGKEWSRDKAWDYVSGLVAKTIMMHCIQYPDDALSTEAYGWCKTYADKAIDGQGNFYNFKKGSLDNIASGKVLIDLCAHESALAPARGDRYRLAADYLYRYLRYDYKRISLADGQGGFIHKDSYPYQMWLDGLYMGAAFYAEYLAAFCPDDTEGWTDIAMQFTTIHARTYDAEQGLNRHGWSALPSDPSSFWAARTEPLKGCSQEFWGRGMGWYAAALVDVLALMPPSHPDYEAVAEIFREVASGVAAWQDRDSGVWYQLLRHDGSFVSRKGNRNYLEASASCMFAYALLKGLRLGLIDEEAYRTVALKAYEGVLDTFITEDASGVDIHRICRSAGLGPANKTERDGSADYYLDGSDVNIVSNEGKGIGSFIMASLEYERYAATASLAGTEEDPSGHDIYYDIFGRSHTSAPAGFYIEVRAGKASKHVR